MSKKKRVLDPIECAVCKKEFIPKNKKVRCCSKSCGGKLGSTKAAREKGKQTRLERYGDPNFNNREKVKKTIQEKYGEQYTNTSQVPEIKQKIVDTYTERHGGMGMASKSAAKKAIDETKRRYGVEDNDSITNTFQIPKVKDKIKETHEERWGGIGFSSEELGERSRNTFKELYGEELETSAYRRSLAQQGLMDKYGTHSAMLVPEIKEKAINNYIKRHGGMGNARDSVKIKLEEDLKKFKALYDSGLHSFYEIEQLMDVSKDTIGRWAGLLGIKVTSPNRLNESWKYFLKEKTGLVFEYEGKIYGENRKRVDLYNDDLKLAIEINPTITHTTQPSVFHGKKVSVKYHQERAIAAEENGWHLIQVFDWDKPEEIAELIKSIVNIEYETVYARKCEIKEVDMKTAKEFTNLYHRQGSKARDNIAYGLFYEGELVQVMTFSKERFVKSEPSHFELIRLCSKDRVKVVGGASRLFKAFVNSEYKPNRVKTFVDYAKGQGKVYEYMGMRYVGLANLNGYYANIDTGEAHKVTSISSKFSKDYKKLGQTQQQFMNERRFFRINDAGNKIFEWNRTQDL